LILSEYSGICYIGFKISPTSGAITLLKLKLITWVKGSLKDRKLAHESTMTRGTWVRRSNENEISGDGRTR